MPLKNTPCIRGKKEMSMVWTYSTYNPSSLRLSAGGEQQRHLRGSWRAGGQVPQPELPQPLWEQDQGLRRPGSPGKTAAPLLSEPSVSP